jgi:hypothetical protein
MASADVSVDIAGEFTGKKAFKQAETATQKLEKGVAKLGKQLLGVFAATKLVSFGKQAVKAFAEDENAARSLGMTLKNLNLDYFGASESVNTYISNLEKQTGVLDDELRPAMDRFLRATSSITESQKLLNLALDISAGTGKNLTTVSQGLQKAYLGNNASLGRLGVGLSKAELTGSSFFEIQERLTELFAGQAKSAADGYLGSINKLTIASNNAKEIIGKDLVDSMQLISGNTGIGGATTAIEGFATEIGNAIYGVGLLIDQINSIPGSGFIKKVFAFGYKTSAIGSLASLGADTKSRLAGTPAQSPGERKQIDKINKEALKFQKQQNELAKIDIGNTTRKLALTADQQALEELKKKFDVERIGLFVALNESMDKETTLRLRSLIAIHDNDAALAGKIKAEIDATNAVNNFATSAARAAALLLQVSYSSGLASFQQSEINSLTQGPAAPIPDVLTTPTPTMPMSPLESFRQSEARYAGNSSPTFIINAQGIGDQQIASVVQSAIQDLNRFGSSTTYAGAI